MNRANSLMARLVIYQRTLISVEITIKDGGGSHTVKTKYAGPNLKKGLDQVRKMVNADSGVAIYRDEPRNRFTVYRIFSTGVTIPRDQFLREMNGVDATYVRD